jgi:hypothetical protein
VQIDAGIIPLVSCKVADDPHCSLPATLLYRPFTDNIWCLASSRPISILRSPEQEQTLQAAT